MPTRTVFSMLVSFTVLLGCEGQPVETFERAEVSGAVWLDGKPLEDAAIVFHALNASGEPTGVSGHAFVDEGRYRIDADHGPAVGQSRVEFRARPVSREQLEASLVTDRGKCCPLPPTLVLIPPMSC